LKFSILNFIQRQLPEFKHARAKLPMLHAKETFIVPKAFGKPQGLKPNSFFSHLARLKPCLILVLNVDAIGASQQIHRSFDYVVACAPTALQDDNLDLTQSLKPVL